MNPTLGELARHGQSIWYDNIRRDMLSNGKMQALIDAGVVGVTSNPTIFQKAVSGSDAYDEQIRTLRQAGKDVVETYDALTRQDIGMTADLFRPVYERTAGRDGFVSIEVNPHLADDTAGTIAEAQRLYAALDRPNVMIKIPGTPAGWPAIEAVLGEGINVNVTLIFSVDAYDEIMQAYLRGVTRFVDHGGDPARLASVASFFVSRVDTMVDPRLTDPALQGQAAVANSKLAYRKYTEVFGGDAFAALRARGVREQRPLWASTSTKNPAYPATLYVASLVGPNTVNTIPAATLDAVLDGMAVEEALTRDVDAAVRLLGEVETAGISMADVTEQLRLAGVKAFCDSYDDLLASIEAKRAALAVG